MRTNHCRLASKYPELLKHLDMEMFTYARGYSKVWIAVYDKTFKTLGI